MSSNEKSASCERLKVLTLDLTARHPGLFKEAPLLMQLLSEANLYQLELETQNEELQKTRQELEASRQQYGDHVPCLCGRGEDVPLLAMAFINELADELSGSTGMELIRSLRGQEADD